MLISVEATMVTVGMEMYQSEVNNTMFVHYVRMTVQPLMLQLKKLVGTEVSQN